MSSHCDSWKSAQRRAYCTEGRKWISTLAVHTFWQRTRPAWHFLLLQRKPSVAHTLTNERECTSQIRFIYLVTLQGTGRRLFYCAFQLLYEWPVKLTRVILQIRILPQTSVWQSLTISCIQENVGLISFCTSNSSLVNTEASIFTLQFFPPSFLYCCPYCSVADGVCLFSTKLKRCSVQSTLIQTFYASEM